MAQTTATKDEDLLIISDDNQTEASLDTDFIDISLEDNSAEESQTDEIIDFSESLIKEDLALESEVETPKEKEETASLETPEINLEISDFSLDLGEETPRITEIESLEDVKKEIDMGGFDLGLSETDIAEETVKENIQEPTDTIKSENSDMGTNDILEDTIGKFEKRQDAISLEKEEKKSHVSELKKQITDLQTEVTTNEEEIDGLGTEGRKITLNIKSLEKMKLGDNSVTKKHNSKRVLKK